MIKHRGFLSPFHRYSPNPWLKHRVVKELAIGRLEGGESSSLCHLHRLASLVRHFPHLIISCPIRSEIDPAPIPRPARYDIIGTLRGQAAGVTSFCAHYEDIGVGFHTRIEGDVPPIGGESGKHISHVFRRRPGELTPVEILDFSHTSV